MAERRGERYHWKTRPRAPEELFRALAPLPPVAVQVLYARGLGTAGECRAFLEGTLRESDDPLLLADMPRAVERIAKARSEGESVAVFTDYDADGVNAASVLASGLRLLGVEPFVRLPNRFADGYGLTPAIVDEVAGRGARVLITADCGSTSFEAAERAEERGLDLIVTDHHRCGERLPRALAVINPWRADCAYPCDHLCGAGVAYKLTQALADQVHPSGRSAMEPLLDLVAVATVADLMPLTGENRRLVLDGLRIMNERPRPGLRALLDVAGVEPGFVDAAALGFRVAPRVNAAGRLDDPLIAFQLLMSEDENEARQLAEEIDRLNRERQVLVRQIEAEAEEIVAPGLASGAAGLVCGAPGWPQGIVGLVAGKLAQRYGRPAIAFTTQGGLATGSARGVPEFDLLAALRTCEDLFTRYGGHQAAAGFSMPADRVAELAQRFPRAVAEQAGVEPRPPTLSVDGFVRGSTITFELGAALEQLGPYGAGFPQPVLALRGARLLESRRVGADGRHWKTRLRAEDGGQTLSGIMFDGGALAEQYSVGDRLDAAFHLRRSLYAGSWRLELELIDVRR